jgi:hypothetical protein
VKADNPALVQHATGDELKLLVQNLTLAKLKGEVWRGTMDLNPTVTNIAGTEATVRDCYLDNTGVYKEASGERVDTQDTQRQLNVIQLTLIDGTWKVRLINKESDGCTAP